MSDAYERGLAERLACLERVVELGDGRLPEPVVAHARDVLARASERLAAGDHLVVAGLLGGTGSGKSSLFNALLGRRLAPVGAVRPVTGESRAAAVGEAQAAERLLDWLGVRHRHHMAPGPGLPAGLVLVDLPDHDSVALDHALVADRFAERLDLLIWVVDPIKYAHEALYDRYLRRLATLAGVTVVALNRSDELGAEDLAACRTDLRRRLDGLGLTAAELVLTSATGGTGVEDLRSRLVHETERRRAAAERVSGDVRAVAAEAAAALPPVTGVEALPVGEVTTSVAAALDVPAAAAEAAAAYTARARARSRSPGGAAVALALRPVRRAARTAVWWLPSGGSDIRPAGPAEPRQPAVVRRALLDLSEAVTRSHARAGRRLRATVTASAEPLLKEAARAVHRASGPPPRRRWWGLLAVLPAAAEAVLVGALLWLALLRIPLLQLPGPPTVETPLGALLLPTAGVVAGAVARLLAGLLRRFAIGLGAARHRDATLRSLREAIGSAVEEHVLAPLHEELGTVGALTAAVDCAGAPATSPAGGRRRAGHDR